MFSDHCLMQLAPRAWAAQTLDAVRAGDPVPPTLVNRALQITGDLPKHFNPKHHRYETEPVPTSDPA